VLSGASHHIVVGLMSHGKGLDITQQTHRAKRIQHSCSASKKGFCFWGTKFHCTNRAWL